MAHVLSLDVLTKGTIPDVTGQGMSGYENHRSFSIAR